MELLNQWWALREDKSDKLNYTLIPPQMLARVAKTYTDWWKVHWKFNRLKWDKQFMTICKESSMRHFMQWMSWETDEDHMAACVFNLFAYETLKDKLSGKLDNYMKEKLTDMVDKSYFKEFSKEISEEDFKKHFIDKYAAWLD